MKKKVQISILCLLLTACAGSSGFEASYPQSPEEKETAKIGKLGGEEGLIVFGGGKSSATDGINVNSYLWRATLDTIYKLPIISADPFGGTVLTDWYELDKKSNTRFKLNIFIIGGELRSDAIRVSAFKQKKDRKGNWTDQAPSTKLSQEIETKILLKAREIKFNSQ